MGDSKRKFKYCIGCLTTEGKIIDLGISGLKESYSSLTGIQDLDKYKIAEWVCWECAASLRRFANFKIKCATAYTLLKDIYVVQEKISKNKLKSIKRDNFGLSSTISRTGTLIIDVTAEEYVKSSHYNDELENDDDYKEAYDDDMIDVKTDNIEIEEITVNNDISEENGGIHIEELIRLNENDDFIDEIEIDQHQKHKTKKRKTVIKEKETKIDTRALEIIVEDEIVLAKDMSEYCSVVALTPEQQREEILKRKDSSNFKRGSYKCDLCYKGFVFKDAHNNHMRKHSPASGEFECNICKVRWPSHKKMTNHIAHVHLLKYYCKMCPFTCQLKDQAQRHYKWHMGVKYKCKICDMEFSRQTTYLSHCRHKHPCSEVCHVCGDSFATPNGLKLHMGLRHKDSKLSYCKECNLYFNNATELKKHIQNSETHRGPVRKECKECKMKFSSSQEYNEHISESHQLDECTGRINGQEAGGETKSSYCSKCKIAFLSKEALTKHILTSFQHKDDSHKIENGCKHCGKTFVDKEGLKAHISSIGPYAFADSDAVDFQCEQCGETMNSHKRYHAHFRKFHRDKTRTYYPAMRAPVMCELCGKMCQTSTALRQHMNSHTGEKPYKCNICSKGFTYSNMLNVHMRTHTNERPYACDICGMAFTIANNLMRHKAVHSNATPYGCEVCGKHFKYKYTVKQHMECVHNKKPWPKKDKKKRAHTDFVYLQQ